MLLKYSVSNFRSIGHNIEFSMFPLENSSDEFLTEINTVAGNLKVLKRGAFFGPNASGKTSFVNSLEFARDYVVKGPRNSTAMKVNQFRGDIDELQGLTRFEFMLYDGKNVYNYGFSLNRVYVSEEWLSILDRDCNFRALFERKTNSRKSTSIKITDDYAKPSTKKRQLADLLTLSIKGKQANQLFLYKLFENGSDIAEAVYSWFRNIQIIYPDTKMQALPLQLKQDNQLGDFISEKLQLLDTGVESVSAVEDNIELFELAEKYNVPAEIVHDIEDIQHGIISLNGELFIFKEGKKQKTTLVRIKFEHLLNNKSVDFNIDDESDGTKRMLDLLPMLFRLGSDSHAIYVVDELDRSLHTKLSKYIINSLGSSNSNTQLLFTAHDVNLLNLQNFRQEEIWFIEKNYNGETRLKPFSDFDINDNQDILKDYLAGRFGAIPVIKEEKL